MQQRISAGVIIERDGRILLVRHVKPGSYDFWVAPGGGVVATESLREAALREAREETGLIVEANALAYIEEFASPQQRHCKFWFLGHVKAGTLSVAAPEAQRELITEAAWLSRSEIESATVFPPVLASQYWRDSAQCFSSPLMLPLRQMAFW
jgi:8-oxo-dGTP diphosphatase